MMSPVSTKWFNDICPALNLVFVALVAVAGASNAAPTAGCRLYNDDSLLHLVVKYEADR